MSFIRKLGQSIKNYHHGRWARQPAYRRLSIQAEELSRIATLEARAYTDQALHSQKAEGLVTYEALERKALLSVQESKAYADDAVSGLSSSLGAVAGAVVELREKVDSVAPSGEKGAQLLAPGLEQKLSGLGRKLDDLQASAGGQATSATSAQVFAKARKTVQELSDLITTLNVVLDRLENEIAEMSVDEGKGSGDEAGGDLS